MVFVNPGGHDWGKVNLDGYGIGYIVFAIVYTLFFLAACGYVWINRHAPVIRMRNIPLAISSLLILHVYIFMVFIVYPLNGSFPCQAEFWIMSLYLPIGIGLFQAQNQQLLIVSNEQNRLLHFEECYKPILNKQGAGSPSYWTFRLKLWWKGTSKQGKYECFVLVGIVVQFIVSLVLYTISRNFNRYGIIGHAVGPGMCRRGWEWIPSIAWQFVWNFFFGPYLLWKIRMIRDIYHWRLQTTMAIIAGLPGTPLWLAGVYSDSFAPVNKYWVPAMWLVPGIMIMQLTTLCFPIHQIIKHNRAAAETKRELKKFDEKVLGKNLPESTTASMTTRSTSSKGKMYSMDTLEECLNTSAVDGLQVYASCVELNGENILFLRKVLDFKKLWHATFTKKDSVAHKARMTMFRAAISMYVSLVDAKTAKYPINIESPIYMALEEMFGEACILVACRRTGSISSSPISAATPWDEPEDPMNKRRETIHLKSITLGDLSDNESHEAILPMDEPDLMDPLHDFPVPGGFTAHVFDNAFKSIKYMVWSETWQRYQAWKRNSGIE